MILFTRNFGVSASWFDLNLILLSCQLVRNDPYQSDGISNNLNCPRYLYCSATHFLLLCCARKHIRGSATSYAKHIYAANPRSCFFFTFSSKYSRDAKYLPWFNARTFTLPRYPIGSKNAGVGLLSTQRGGISGVKWCIFHGCFNLPGVGQWRNCHWKL